MSRKPHQRKQEILTAALVAARKSGFQNVKRDIVAIYANCSPALITVYFKTMPQLHRAIIGEAIRTKDLDVIAQGLAAKDPRTKKLDESVKRAALERLL